MKELILDVFLCVFFVSIAIVVGMFVLLGCLWLIEKLDETVVDSKNKNAGEH